VGAPPPNAAFYINRLPLIFPAMTFSNLFLIGNLGGSEVFIILAVLLLFFGAKRIPELARGLGKGVKEFKDATNHDPKAPVPPTTVADDRRPDGTTPVA
jgi:sec-independent protein translocase protein TatA